MASLKQLRKIFAPILAEHPDLVLQGRWLFRPPIENAIIGAFIDRTSSANNSRMSLSILPLSRSCSPWVLGHERAFEVERVIGAPVPERWIPGKREDPPRIYQDMFTAEYQEHLRLNFNAKARPFLDQVRSLQDVVASITPFRELPLRTGPPELIDAWIAAIEGNFAVAADHLQSFFDRMGPPPAWIIGDDRREEEAVRDVLRTGDGTAIASHLHALEERTIAAFDLQRFWRQTPFPFER